MIPYISYRIKPNGGGIRNYPYPNGNALNNSNITLLIHGYNNTFKQANSSYDRFIDLQDELATVTANLVGVFWPGDNWEGPLYYMQAISKVKKVAPLLARDIYNVALARGYLHINIIAHSLGCRLALETIREILIIQQTALAPGLHLDKVIFMAGAAPIDYLDLVNGQPMRLRNAIDAFDKSMSIYSESDSVLHYGFPLGQTFRGEGIFPIALGRRFWPAGKSMPYPLRQENNYYAGHSDYWGSESENETALKQVAQYVRSFIDLGSVPNRKIPTRNNSIGKNTLSRQPVLERFL